MGRQASYATTLRHYSHRIPRFTESLRHRQIEKMEHSLLDNSNSRSRLIARRAYPHQSAAPLKSGAFY